MVNFNNSEDSNSDISDEETCQHHDEITQNKIRGMLNLVRPPLKMTHLPVRLCAAVLSNVNYVSVFMMVPNQFSLRCENSENYLANGYKKLFKNQKLTILFDRLKHMRY